MRCLFLLLLHNKKKGKPRRTARSKFTILKQICELVPAHLVTHLARKYGVEDKCRTSDPWSHVVSLLNAQLAHSLSLNDVCDTLQNHSGGADNHKEGYTSEPERTVPCEQDEKCGYGGSLVSGCSRMSSKTVS